LVRSTWTLSIVFRKAEEKEAAEGSLEGRFGRKKVGKIEATDPESESRAEYLVHLS
jgi:hypothetical protein